MDSVITYNRAEAEATRQEDLAIRITAIVRRDHGIDAAERFIDNVGEITHDVWNGRTVIVGVWVEDPNMTVYVDEADIPRSMFDIGTEAGWHVGRL